MGHGQLPADDFVIKFKGGAPAANAEINVTGDTAGQGSGGYTANLSWTP